MLNLKNITLWGCCWSDDADMLERTIRVLNYCQTLVGFHEVLLFSRHYPGNVFNGKALQIPRLTAIEWNIFVNRIVPLAIKSDYAMSVHEDGFILQPELWSAEFLNYDYIGAPWPQYLGPWKKGSVGNGGFCIESKKLLEAKLSLPFEGSPVEPSDVFVCSTHLERLQQQGLCWAPRKVAAGFSTEYVYGEIPSFGFHGRNTKKYLIGWQMLQEAKL